MRWRRRFGGTTSSFAPRSRATAVTSSKRSAMHFALRFARASDAVAAAEAAQRAIAAHDWSAIGDLQVRMALHSGTTDERDGDYFGPALNRVSRLLSIAHGGQTVASGATAQLLRGLLPPQTGFAISASIASKISSSPSTSGSSSHLDCATGFRRSRRWVHCPTIFRASSARWSVAMTRWPRSSRSCASSRW